MEPVLGQIRALGAAFLDGWFVVDGDRRIIEFNSQFRGLFTRSQARQLNGSQCCQFLALGVCEGGACLARRCIEDQAPVRYDEITATREGDGETLRVIASAAPITTEDGSVAALVVLRDVSDAADVQRKYKSVHEQHAREKDALRDVIARKTKELMDANMELNRIQKELMRFKKGLFGS